MLVCHASLDVMHAWMLDNVESGHGAWCLTDEVDSGHGVSEKYGADHSTIMRCCVVHPITIITIFINTLCIDTECK